LQNEARSANRSRQGEEDKTFDIFRMDKSSTNTTAWFLLWSFDDWQIL